MKPKLSKLQFQLIQSFCEQKNFISLKKDVFLKQIGFHKLSEAILLLIQSVADRRDDFVGNVFDLKNNFEMNSTTIRNLKSRYFYKYKWKNGNNKQSKKSNTK